MPESENFDRVYPEERGFVIGGQTFHWQPLHWRKLGDLAEREDREREEREQAAREAAERNEEVPEETLLAQYERIVKRIIEYIEPSERESFQAIINDPDKHISTFQLVELNNWLGEVTNNRPTQQPSSSDAGRGSAAPTLQAV